MNGAPTPVRLVVTSDQPLVGDAIRAALGSRGFDAISLRPARAPEQLREFAARVTEFRPDAGLVLWEREDPLLLEDAAALVAAVRVDWLVLARATDGAAWGGLLEAGAVGVMSMSTGLDELATALRRVVSGQLVIRQATRSRLVREWRVQEEESRRLSGRIRLLTQRDLDVLRLLREGHSVASIADRTGAPVDAVRLHVGVILERLGVSSRAAAVASYERAMERDLLRHGVRHGAGP